VLGKSFLKKVRKGLHVLGFAWVVRGGQRRLVAPFGRMLGSD
jgi:hypothetical protein